MRNVRALLSQGVIAVATIAVFGGTAQAAVIETQYNPVADNAINTTGGNNDRSDWAAVPAYAVDANESATSDWSSVSIAHDSGNFYLRYVMNQVTNDFGWIDGNQRVFIDADQNRSTGFTGGGDQLPIGADYMIEGSGLHSFAGASSITWLWNSVGGLVYDDFPAKDQELTLPRASIGSPVDFDFVLFASGTPEDYYPNAGNTGAAGDYFTYSTVPVPEPAALGLIVVGLGLTARRRKV